MISFFLRGAALTAGLSLVAGCNQAPLADTSWKPIDPASMSKGQKEQKARAMAAKEAMFSQLMGKLTQELGKGGPANAISVCQDEAPRIAQQVSTDKGVKIGRTALKLRNSKNLPPSWAKDLIERSAAEPAFLANAKGELAALLPIKLQAQCLLCHGSGDQITAEARMALSRRYPNDQATDFKEGDLRGWFWIEVPASE